MEKTSVEQTDFIFRKVVVVIYVAMVNFIISIILAQLIKKFISKPYDSKRNYFLNILHVLITIISIVVCNYIGRNIMEHIPLPLANDLFDPKKVKETKGTVTTAFSYFMFLASDLKTYTDILSLPF
jgi:hypothetical protein